MESKDELKEHDIKKCTCYYFDDIIRARYRDTHSSNVLLDEKLYKENYENILVHNISYKTSTGAKPLRIMFDKIDGFIKIRDGIRCLVLFDFGWCDKIYHRNFFFIYKYDFHAKQKNKKRHSPGIIILRECLGLN